MEIKDLKISSDLPLPGAFGTQLSELETFISKMNVRDSVAFDTYTEMQTFAQKARAYSRKRQRNEWNFTASGVNGFHVWRTK